MNVIETLSNSLILLTLNFDEIGHNDDTAATEGNQGVLIPLYELESVYNLQEDLEYSLYVSLYSFPLCTRYNDYRATTSHLGLVVNHTKILVLLSCCICAPKIIAQWMVLFFFIFFGLRFIVN